ncbi:MAG: DNA-binding response regulator, partial [Chloroflexi bacterium RIFOXYD12_FULL_57_15]
MYHIGMKTILVVDDTASVRQLLQDYLTQQGFRIVTASNGQEAIYAARHSNPDVILLDIMMPQMDGFEFLRHFRKEKQTPVIVITAKEEETDAVLGLELGADDYVIKPFRMRELLSRVRAVLRRQEAAADPNRILQLGDLTLDPATHTVSARGAPADLTPLEFDLLALLMSAPGRV